jgi:hypothetical protein
MLPVWLYSKFYDTGLGSIFPEAHVESEKSVNDSVQTNKMINKRLKCSTTTHIYLYIYVDGFIMLANFIMHVLVEFVF